VLRVRASASGWFAAPSFERMLGREGPVEADLVEAPIRPPMPGERLIVDTGLERGRDLVVDARTAADQGRLADQRWNAALEATEFAPPDPGFGARVRDIADASEQEAAALRLADSSGVGWNPVPSARRMRLSYELRPGGNRRGTPELWDQFDTAVERLGDRDGGRCGERSRSRVRRAVRRCAEDCRRA
jgi:hypothetical protein